MEKKFWLQIVGLMILIFGAFALTFNPAVLSQFGLPNLSFRMGPTAPQKRVAIVDSAPSADASLPKALFNVEVAGTDETRKLGLGGRESLASDSGMLFIFEKSAKRSFWMKGMKIPIDIIWIRGDEIVDILQNVPPPLSGQKDSELTLYAPLTEVDKVLEINSGYAAKYGIKVGDKIR